MIYPEIDYGEDTLLIAESKGNTFRKAVFPMTVFHKKTIGLYDTGADVSCIQKAFLDNNFPNIQFDPLVVQLKCANGSSLKPVGMAKVLLQIGGKTFPFSFTVCAKLQRNIIVGVDLTSFYRIGFDYTTLGTPFLRHKNSTLVIQKVENELLDPMVAQIECEQNVTNNVALSPDSKFSSQDLNVINPFTPPSMLSESHDISTIKFIPLIRLTTKEKVVMQPNTVSIIAVNSHTPRDIPTKWHDKSLLFEVVKSPMLQIEYPELMVRQFCCKNIIEMCGSQAFTKIPVSTWIFNNSKSKVVIPPKVTLAFMQQSSFEIPVKPLSKICEIWPEFDSQPKFKRTLPVILEEWKQHQGKSYDHVTHRKPVDNSLITLPTVQINQIDEDTNNNSEPIQDVRKLFNPPDTAMVMGHNFYPKPKPFPVKEVKVPTDIKKKFDKLMVDYEDIISKSPSDVGDCPYFEMTIDTDPGALPCASKPYPLALQHKDFVKAEIQGLLDAGIISKSFSQYGSPIHVVHRKHKEGAELRDTKRLVIDFRQLNKQLMKVDSKDCNQHGTLSMFPGPKIETLWHQLRGHSIFSSVDLRSGFHSIRIRQSDRHKTAFVTDFGKFQFNRCCFGIASSPDFLKALMHSIFGDLSYFCLVYMDDLLIYSDSPEEHLEHLEIIFEKFRRNNLKIKLSKCAFWKSEIEFLGHTVSPSGIKATEDKKNAVNNLKPPKNVKETKSLLGLLGFLCQYIPAYSTVINHINRLTRKNVPFIWDQNCQNSLDLAKSLLLSSKVLRYPDRTKPFHLFCDASKYTWSGVLMQHLDEDPPQEDSKKEITEKGVKGTESTIGIEDTIINQEITTQPKFSDNSIKRTESAVSVTEKKPRKRGYMYYKNAKLYPITYHSGTFSPTQVNWSANTKEAYAIFRSITRMSFFVTDSEVIVHSDHKPLRKFIEGVTANPRVLDWALYCHSIVRKLSIEFIKGSENVLCDVLSRLRYNKIYTEKEPEKEGYEFGKPLSDDEGSMRKEPKVINAIEHMTDSHQSNMIGTTEFNKQLNSIREETMRQLRLSCEDMTEINNEEDVIKSYEQNTGRDLIDDPIIDKIVTDKGPFDLPSTDNQTIREVNVISEFNINENGYHLDPEIKEKHTVIESRIKSEDIVREQGTEFSSILKQLRKDPDKYQAIYQLDEEGRLMKIVRHSGTRFDAIMVPKPLVPYLLYEAHESMSHPGSLKMYMFLHQRYYWYSMRKDINDYVRKCLACQLNPLKDPTYVTFSTKIPAKIPFGTIAVDLIKLSPTTQGNCYALTCMDLFTSFLLIVPIPDKTSKTVIDAYRNKIYSIVAGSTHILSDNGSEFKGESFRKMVKALGLNQVFSSPRNPTSNSVLERSHAYIKDKIRKVTVTLPNVEWDEIIYQIQFSYNVTPRTVAGESPYFLLFRKDPILPRLDKLLQPKIRYYGEETDTQAKVDAMHIIYDDLFANLIKARKAVGPSRILGENYRIGDMVSVRTYKAGKLESKFGSTPFRVTKLLGEKTCEVMNPHGQIQKVSFKDIVRTNPTDNLISQIPASMQYGRTAKYLTSELPELLRKLKGIKPGEVINSSEKMRVWPEKDQSQKASKRKTREQERELKHDYNLRSKTREKERK